MNNSSDPAAAGSQSVPPGYAPLSPAPQGPNMEQHASSSPSTSSKQPSTIPPPPPTGGSYIQAAYISIPYQPTSSPSIYSPALPGQPYTHGVNQPLQTPYMQAGGQLPYGAGHAAAQGPSNQTGGQVQAFGTFYQQAGAPPAAGAGMPYGYAEGVPVQGYAAYPQHPYNGQPYQASYPPNGYTTGAPIPPGYAMSPAAAAEEENTPFRCSTVWILFALGFICPITWFIGAFTWRCFYNRSRDINDRRAGAACSIAFSIMVVILTFSIFYSMRAAASNSGNDGQHRG